MACAPSEGLDQPGHPADLSLRWAHMSFCWFCHEAAHILFQIRTRFGIGRFPKKRLDEAKVSSAKEELTKGLNHIAEYILKDQPFICGDEISAADLIGVNEIIHMDGVNENELYEKNATVNAWIKRVADRMAPHFEESLLKLKAINKMFNEGTPVDEESTDIRL